MRESSPSSMCPQNIPTSFCLWRLHGSCFPLRARSIIAHLTQESGTTPLFFAPVDFAELLRKRMEAAAEGGDQAEKNRDPTRLEGRRTLLGTLTIINSRRRSQSS